MISPELGFRRKRCFLMTSLQCIRLQRMIKTARQTEWANHPKSSKEIHGICEEFCRFCWFVWTPGRSIWLLSSTSSLCAWVARVTVVSDRQCDLCRLAYGLGWGKYVRTWQKSSRLVSRLHSECSFFWNRIVGYYRDSTARPGFDAFGLKRQVINFVFAKKIKKASDWMKYARILVWFSHTSLDFRW